MKVYSITCIGLWDVIKKDRPERVVVFTDLVEVEN